MNINDLKPTLTIDDKINQVREMLEVAKVIGMEIGGVLIKENCGNDKANAILCLYVACSTGSVKSDNGAPAFPMFFDSEVAEMMLKRSLYKILDSASGGGVQRWFIRFSDTWI